MFFRKVFLLVLIACSQMAFAANTVNETGVAQKSSTTKKVLVGGTIGAGTFAAFVMSKNFDIAAVCLVVAAWVAAGCYALSVTKEITSDIKSFMWPSKEKIEKDLKYAAVYKLLKAEKVLQESLIKNADGKRGVLGIPVVCEKDARDLEIAGGKVQLESLIERFEFCYGENSPFKSSR